MFGPGDIISYLEMCSEEEVNLQRGMNFHLGRTYSVILMSLREGAPYADRIEEDGRVLIYEGHDEPRSKDLADPKKVDQPLATPNGTPTQNGLFYQAAQLHKSGKTAEKVRVYEKIRAGIWTYNGIFDLVDSWFETINRRKVVKFRLVLSKFQAQSKDQEPRTLASTRMIPPSVKIAVWKRDHGKCVVCGSTRNLHFDHVIPFSKGGSSLVAENIQLLCAKHNLEKRDRIA